VYHPKIEINTLYQHFKPYLNWDWVNAKNSSLPLCNAHHLPMACHFTKFNIEQPALIYIIGKNNMNIWQDNIFCFQTEYPDKNKNSPRLIILAEQTIQQIQNINPHAFDKINIPIFATQSSAQACLDFLLPYCYHQLSLREIQHGTFIEVMGKGVLLTGKSGVGKSLAALYCLKNHHVLIADDAPFFYQYGTQLIGGCPSKLANLLEIRNLGIIDVTKSYGAQHVNKTHILDMIITLTSTPDIERPTIIQQNTEIILGIPIPKISLPFTENVAILIENAVRCLYTNQISNS